MRYLLMALVVVSGMATPVHLAANKRLFETVRSPLMAMAIALGIGAAGLALAQLTGLAGRADLAHVAKAPWWAWTGGLLIAAAVSIQIVNTERSGGGPVVALIVAGQLVCAMVIDHFGWMDMQQNPIRWWKILGVVLMAGGAALMEISGR